MPQYQQNTITGNWRERVDENSPWQPSKGPKRAVGPAATAAFPIPPSRVEDAMRKEVLTPAEAPAVSTGKLTTPTQDADIAPWARPTTFPIEELRGPVHQYVTRPLGSLAEGVTNILRAVPGARNIPRGLEAQRLENERVMREHGVEPVFQAPGATKLMGELATGGKLVGKAGELLGGVPAVHKATRALEATWPGRRAVDVARGVGAGYLGGTLPSGRAVPTPAEATLFGAFGAATGPLGRWAEQRALDAKKAASVTGQSTVEELDAIDKDAVELMNRLGIKPRGPAATTPPVSTPEPSTVIRPPTTIWTDPVRKAPTQPQYAPMTADDASRMARLSQLDVLPTTQATYSTIDNIKRMLDRLVPPRPNVAPPNALVLNPEQIAELNALRGVK